MSLSISVLDVQLNFLYKSDFMFLISVNDTCTHPYAPVKIQGLMFNIPPLSPTKPITSFQDKSSLN